MTSGPPTTADDRRLSHGTVSNALQRLTDGDLAGILARSSALGSGIGGSRSLIQIGNVPVFVKRVPLTEEELTPEGFRSTANLFALPMSCHYGIASPGFGAWREAAANERMTRLVLQGATEPFPMLYAWRVYPEPLDSTDLRTICDDVAEHWRDTPEVEARLDAIARAPASLILFFENIPETLPNWMASQSALGVDATDAAVETVERGMVDIVAGLEAARVTHFDAHLGNMVTDGTRVYLTDFGLASSSDFRLSEQEQRFISANATHDRCHMMTRLVNWLVATCIDGDDWELRNERIRAVSRGDRKVLGGLSAPATATVERHAAVAAIINDFYVRLRFDDRHAVYPTEAIARALTGPR